MPRVAIHDLSARRAAAGGMTGQVAFSVISLHLRDQAGFASSGDSPYEVFSEQITGMPDSGALPPVFWCDNFRHDFHDAR
jgi:hypothetical protein